MNVTEGVDVEIRTRQEGGKIRVEFMTDTREEKELVQKRFEEYRDNTTKEFNSLVIRFNNERASELEREGLRVEALLAVGDPAREITAAAEREQCDLIAMATHGHKFLADVVYGSVANAVRHATMVPVLLLRRPVTT